MRAWSFSSLNQFETCPRQYDLTKNKKVIVFTDTVHTIWGKEVHTALEDYLNDTSPLEGNYAPYKPFADKILSMPGEKLVEWQFALKKDLTPTGFQEEDAWCRGIIDIGVVHEDQALVGDWKTGKVRPDSDQLKLFAAATMQHYPQVQTVKTVYVWLAHGKVTTETYRRSDLPGIWSHFFTKVARLEQSYVKDKWIPKPSGLCNGWCGAGRDHCEFWAPRR